MISVIIPLHNALPFLTDAIDSVLAQTHEDLELIIVDDVSTDGSLAVAESYIDRDQRVRVVRQTTNRGSSATRNRGAEEAKGEWLAFLDNDDISYPERLELQLKAAANDPSVLLWGSALEIISHDRRTIGIEADGPTTLEEYERELRLGHPVAVAGPTFFLRRSTFFDVGGFDPDLSFVDDTDFADRTASRGPIRMIGQPLVRYRKHTRQVSSQKFRAQASMDRYVWWRATARARGDTLPPYNEWKRMYAQLPRRRRWRDAISDRSRLYLRRSVYAYTERRYASAAASLVTSVALNPLYLPRRAWSRTSVRHRGAA